MRYLRFTIKNYRAITGPLEVKLEKSLLMPIIGVNESGKTTALQAIFAFDHFNDSLSEGRQLQDLSNLYKVNSPASTISAEIDVNVGEMRQILDDCEEDNSSPAKMLFASLRKKKNLPTLITITRDLVTQKYSTNHQIFGSPTMQDFLCRQIISNLPYILYFDDFKDKIAEKVEIPPKPTESLYDWVGILQQLFKQTDPSFSIFKLAAMETRQRRSVLAKVEKHLNKTLTKEWQSFRLDDRDALKIAIQFEYEAATSKQYLKLDVVETDSDGDEHFFFISDRSKGFYWFFNFVMKLEFNPKILSGNHHSVYLLDEPGSYLHAFAQRKLCLKLKQISEKNAVIYCTHSHYLLDPEVVPFGKIIIADKDGLGNVVLSRIYDFKGSVAERRSALQPVLDALQVKPYALDLIHTQCTVIVEGMYDYFSMEMFRDSQNVSLLPSVGADSIKFYVSMLIAWNITFRALWDNDEEGRRKFTEAEKLFGDEVASRCFRLLPVEQADHTKRIMQNLYDGSDLAVIRSELGLASDSSFERTIQAFFYSSKRQAILEKVSNKTKSNFAELYHSLNLQ